MNRLILYLLLLFTSCNEHLKIDRNNDPQGVADSQFVGSWKIVEVSSDVAHDWNNDGSTERDIYGTWSACQKDHLFTFSGEVAASTGTEKKGTFKINCSTTKNGLWYVDGSQHYLVYIPEGLLPESEKIVSMTAAQFRSAIDVTLPNGQPSTITKTWIRQ